MKKNELSTVNNKELTKLSGFGSVEDMKQWATTVIDSGLLPNNITQAEEVVAIVLHGKELGLEPMIALNNLQVIAGRVTLSSSIMGALLKRRGIEWIWPEDFEKIIDKETGAIEMLNDTTPNRRTTIKFFWKSDITDRVMEADFSVTWAQMALAGYVTKDNWLKYPKEMLRARCLTYAIRALHPDILSGFYTDVEMNDTHSDSTAVNVSEEGEVILEVNAEE